MDKAIGPPKRVSFQKPLESLPNLRDRLNGVAGIPNDYAMNGPPSYPQKDDLSEPIDLICEYDGWTAALLWR